MNDTTKENKMGVMPIPKLLMTMSLPMVISMLVQALYNIIDSVFVAQINEEALTAVSLAFPVQNLMIAIATGTGVGINALLSRNLGEKRFKEAKSRGLGDVYKRQGCEKRNLSRRTELHCHRASRSVRLPCFFCPAD